MWKNVALLTAVSIAVAIPSLSMADGSVDVRTDSGQRFITVETGWGDLTAEQRKQVVDEAVKDVENEISAKAPLLKSKAPGLADKLLSPAFVNQVTMELNRYLDGIDLVQSHTKKTLKQKVVGLLERGAIDALPRAVLITIGGSADFHFLLGAKGALDLGLVVMLAPTFRTVIDTAERDAGNRPMLEANDQLSWDLSNNVSLVAVPHGYLGLGVGAGVNLSVGVAGLWSLHGISSAKDVHGVIAAAYGNIDLPTWLLPPAWLGLPVDGGGVDLGLIANAQHWFLLVRFEGDKGVEANATADMEGGMIEPLSSYIKEPGTLATELVNKITGKKAEN